MYKVYRKTNSTIVIYTLDEINCYLIDAQGNVAEKPLSRNMKNNLLWDAKWEASFNHKHDLMRHLN